MPNPRHIFISYSSQDRERVNLLADELGEMFADATIWYDTSLDRTGGQHWWDTICEQIRACAVFIRVVSMTENASVPCQRERSYATALNRPVLPIRIDAVDIRDLEARYQATQIVDFREGSLAQRKALKASIQGLPPAPPLPDNAVELQPAAPLDPIGVLRDRIRTLGSDAREQRQLINDIHELEYQDKYKAEIPDLVARLRVHREILVGASLDLMAKLFGTNETSQTPPPLTVRLDSEPKLDSAVAYVNRGIARNNKGDKDGAISLHPTPRAVILTSTANRARLSRAPTACRSRDGTLPVDRVTP